MLQKIFIIIIFMCFTNTNANVLSNKDYFPLQIGNYWIYEHLEIDSTFDYVRTVDTLRINTRLYYHFIEKKVHKYYPDEEYDYFYHRDSLGQLWFYNVRTQEEELSWLRFDIAPGVISVEYDSVNDLTYRISLLDTAAVVATPAGTFYSCYHFEELIEEIFTDFDDWYAPDVGLIRTASEGESTILTGAYVTGILYGDTVVTNIRDLPDKIFPRKVLLAPNYPNPFNLTTTISYELKFVPRAETELIIYDIHGSEIVKLYRGRQGAGSYSFQWDGKDKNGETISSGVYISSLRVGSLIKTQKIILLK